MNIDVKFYIYGAGRYAKLLYTYIVAAGKENNILGFVVSNKDENEKELFQIPILEIDEVPLNNIDAYFIIAIKDYKNIIINLEKTGFSNVDVLKDSEIELLKKSFQDNLKSLKIKKNQIMCTCFAGRGYECNCKYIAEYLIKNINDYRIIWNVSDFDKYYFPDKIKQDIFKSVDYYIDINSSAIVISNCDNPEDVVNDKVYFINTWHGTGPFKKVNASLPENYMNPNWMNKMKKIYNRTDLFVSNSADNTDMFKESFMYEGEIANWGNPRNDLLFQKNSGIELLVKKRLEIDRDTKIVLYAPTFRKDAESSIIRYDLNFENIINSLQKRFDGQFVLLYRFHHMIKDKIDDWNFKNKGINVTFYSDVMELIKVADVLITDYSSIMWDFSLLHKPVFLYHNDEAEYKNERDFYWPVDRWPYIKAHTSEEMCEKILAFDEEKYLADLEQFFIDDPSYDDGHATERVVARIMDVIDHPEKYGKT